MRKYQLLLPFVLCASLSLAAQTAVELTDQEAQVWDHLTGRREAIHADMSKLNPIERMNAEVELDVIVSAGGEVLQAHATRGPAQFYEQAEAIERARLFKPFTRDGNPVLAKVRDAIAVVPPESWLPNKVPFPEKVDLTSLVIELRRTRCYGSCPVYTVSLEGSGAVHFAGEDSVLIPGHHTSHVSRETMRALVTAFRKANFLSAKDSYSASITDIPSQTIVLRMGVTTKTVGDYGGSMVGLPEAIQALEQQIDDAAGTERWVKGNGETYPSLVAEHWDFSSRSADNMALYRSAIEHNDEDMLELLLRAKAPADIADEKERREAPICVASGSGNADLVERMFAQQAAMSKAILQPCLTAAARSGNVELLDFWIDRGAKPARAGSVLENGILSGNAAMVRRLLDYPVNVHERVNDDTPLLSFAIERTGDGKEGPEIISMLLKAGASPNEKDGLGQTALFSLGLQGAAIQPLVSSLVASGADVNARDNNGDTAMMNHAFIPELVGALLAAGSDPTLVDKQGQTAAMKALQYGCEACAKTLEEAVRHRAE